MEHVKRCGRRGSDVLHSEHKLIMMLLCIACVVHVPGAVHIHTVAPYTHALMRDNYPLAVQT